MQELLKADLARCVRLLPKEVIALCKEKTDKVFVAGGFIRACIANERINDVDLFAPSKIEAELYSEKLKVRGRDIHKTDNAFTILGHRHPLQVISRWTFNTPEQCIASFDFTIVCAIIWYNGECWKSACDAEFYPDLAAKRLTYRSPVREEEPGGSMLRVLKYYQRGYRIPLQSMAAVVTRLISKIENIERLTDEERIKIIKGLLYNVDPDLDPEHIGHL